MHWLDRPVFEKLLACLCRHFCACDCRPVGCYRHYVFNISVPSVCACMPSRGILRFAIEFRLTVSSQFAITPLFMFVLLTLHHLTHRVSVISMMNRRCRGHVDLRVAVSAIKRFQFLFVSVCSDVQVASDDVR